LKNRYFIKLSYNGANYHGWQEQDNSITVQQKINEALSKLLGEEINTIGAGRTDTGVHAKEFYAHFDFSKTLDELEIKQLSFKLNRFLPFDIAINSFIAVKENAHARFDAISRTYQYFVSKTKTPFNKDFSYYVYGKLDIEKMNKAAETLFEYDDFSSFSKSGTQVKTNICKIYHAKWEINDEGLLVFTIKADRFLRNMVRAIVGTLLDVGKEKININDFRNIIENKNRSDAGFSVPAHALFLTIIEYPDNIFE